MRDYYGRYRAGMIDNSMDIPMKYESDIVTSGQTQIVYSRFFNTGTQPCAIWKQTITKDSSGNTTNYKHEYAYAPWSERTTTTYHPINECWTL